MTEKTWQVEKIKYCEHVGREVAIENELIFPAEFLPDTPPQVVARRCSHATECNMIEHPTCSLCGTNPDVDPV